MTTYAVFSIAADFGHMIPVREVEAASPDLAVAGLADVYRHDHGHAMPPCRLMVIPADAVTSIEWGSIA